MTPTEKKLGEILNNYANLLILKTSMEELSIEFRNDLTNSIIKQILELGSEEIRQWKEVKKRYQLRCGKLTKENWDMKEEIARYREALSKISSNAQVIAKVEEIIDVAQQALMKG